MTRICQDGWVDWHRVTKKATSCNLTLPTFRSPASTALKTPLWHMKHEHPPPNPEKFYKFSEKYFPPLNMDVKVRLDKKKEGNDL